jgi:hypothetical protein
MSQQQTITYLEVSTNVIAATQDVDADNPVIINITDTFGNILDIAHLNPTPQFIIPNFQRTITISSGDDLSGVNFTIIGYDVNGQAIIDVVTGENAGTATSTEEFHIILSIVPDNDATDVTVGVGDSGTSAWMLADNNRTNSSLISFQIEVTGTVDYTIEGTLTMPISFEDNTFQLINCYSEPVLAGFTNATDSQIDNVTRVYQAYKAIFTASSGFATITMLQEGI